YIKCISIMSSLYDLCPSSDIHSFPTRRSSDLRPTPFSSGKKVTVTVKFAAQLVAPEMARAAPRISLGNISPNNTHITGPHDTARSEEHTSELQSRFDLVCRLLLEKKNKTIWLY